MLTRALAAVLPVGALAALVVAVGPSATSASSTGCRPLDVTDTAPAVVDDLLAGGWRSSPLDHLEALYAPGCPLPGAEARP